MIKEDSVDAQCIRSFINLKQLIDVETKHMLF